MPLPSPFAASWLPSIKRNPPGSFAVAGRCAADRSPWHRQGRPGRRREGVSSTALTSPTGRKLATNFNRLGAVAIDLARRLRLYCLFWGWGPPMRAFGIVALAFVLPLTGCQTDMVEGQWFPSPFVQSKEQLAAKKAEWAAKDDETCRGYGAKPGSDIYIQCRMNRQQSRDTAENAPVAAPVIVNNVSTPPPSYPTLQPIINSGPRCTSRGC
jgi:hypothetical protein